MIISCFRDAVVATQLISGKNGEGEDETPRGRPYSKRGGIVKRVVMAVDLYFVIPKEMGYAGYMKLVQDHFANEITKWNEGTLEYIKRPSSSAKADESFYSSKIVQQLQSGGNMFAYEISDMDEVKKTFKYHGCYYVHAWRTHDGRALTRPNLPYDWNIPALNEAVRRIVK